ncbi:hypothetical protein [Propionivibrio limicola]|uniref:hypothetical protein n=1 Tax=Propionivibrio limicola TaxID=167645 RepID=UPI0012924A05|nr:hypothetical protein [Propionivibrio limicola]
MNTQQQRVNEPTKPAIPALLVVPGDAHDFSSLYAIATAYAHSGELLNGHAARTDQVTFAFPAMVCSSFAVELFLKFFLTLDNADNPTSPQDDRRGHYLQKLWERIKPDNQDLIAGMFRNPSHTPVAAGLATRKALFLEALTGIGNAPFVEWRYAYEIEGPALMSQGAVAEVLDAVGYAAEHVMKERRAAAAALTSSATPNPACPPGNIVAK